MAVPLQTKQRIIGLIYLDSPFVLREFTTDDLSLLTVMANVAAIRIENVRLAEVKEADRIMQRDLTQAAEIQRRMLPDEGAAGAGRRPGGVQRGVPHRGRRLLRLFFRTRRPRRMALRLSGKGMPGSLMMMALHARVQVLAEDPGDLASFMTRLNKATCAKCPAQPVHHLFLHGDGRGYGRAGIRQRRAQSADCGARLGENRNCWKAAAPCWASCRLHRTRSSARISAGATCWCSIATASPRPRTPTSMSSAKSDSSRC